MATFKLLPAAEKDLESIWLYTIEEWGLAQAEAHIDQLDEAFQLVAENPWICRERNEFVPTVRIYYQSHHLIIYKEFDGLVLVIRVLHESMDVEERLME